MLNVGIAGYGVVGKRRRHYIDSHNGLKTIAVCDQSFNNSGKLLDGVNYYHHYADLLKEDLDILFVCLPNYLASEVTMAGIHNKIHTFCEKPPGKTVKDIERVILIQKRNPNVCLKYGFNHRYHKSVKEAIALVDSGKLGEIINLRGVYGKSRIIPFSGGWRATREYSGGGILLDQGIHMVDLMRLFCGEFVDVKSFVSNSYWKHDVEDNAYAIMRDEHGKVAILHSSATQWQHRFSLDITLTDGYLQLQGILSGSKSYGEEKLSIGYRSESDKGTLQERTIIYLEDNSWRDEVFEFADSVLNKTEVVNGTSQDALETMKLVYRIYNADEDWKRRYNIS